MPDKKIFRLARGIAAGWIASAWWLRIVAVVIVLLAVRSVYYTLISEPEYVTVTSQKSDIEVCVEKGVEYFKSIGSYPTLQSDPNIGRSAEDVARERCRRTITAF